MKICKWIAWVFLTVAVLLILFAGVAFVFDINTGGINKISFFHAANSFLLLTIALYLLTDQFGKCCSKEEKQ
jgi:hypothetical protein